MIVALRELMDALEADPAVKVVVCDSADDEYFIAHFDVARGAELPGDPGLTAWPDLATRLTRAPFVTIADIRGRARFARRIASFEEPAIVAAKTPAD